jgi:hypothetical protein
VTALSNSHYKNQFFESPPTAGFQKTDFVVSCAKGAGNNKISLIMRIAGRHFCELVSLPLYSKLVSAFFV